jgi:hypothetical protein
MSIFKRAEKNDGQVSTSSEKAPQPPKLMPPVMSNGPTAPRATAAPGVVPPPAAPIYSMRAPEPPSTEKATPPREAQRPVHVSVEPAVPVAPQRPRTTAAPVASVAKRPAQQPPVRRVPRPAAPQAFDPVRCAQTAMLNLAWNWQQAGAPIRAIHCYMELLHRYPDSAAADAAIADLADLSEKLAHEGQFHTALGIYYQLEELM